MDSIKIKRYENQQSKQQLEKYQISVSITSPNKVLFSIQSQLRNYKSIKRKSNGNDENKKIKMNETLIILPLTGLRKDEEIDEVQP